MPRVVGPIRRRGPVEVRNVEFLRAATDRAIKVALPGPFTLAQQVRTSSTATTTRSSWTTPRRSKEELRELEAAGADVIQLDEPWLRENPQAAGASPSRRSTARSRV